jgi:hypothetical protein
MKTLILVFCLIAAFTVTAFCQSPGPAFSPNSIRFPEIEGWVRGGVNPLPGESSGIVIGYDTTDGEVEQHSVSRDRGLGAGRR